jgi:ABC-type polysaccharide/polyol phosphate export permease
MKNYLSAVWRCRYFWWSLVKMDLRTRYRRSILGMGWSLLHPIAMTAVLCLVFHKVFHADIREYGPFLLAGLATWNYIVTVSIQGCQCFFQGESYIRQHPAPLAVYPLRTALGGTVHFLIALVVVLVLTWGLKGFGNLSCLVCLLPALLLLFTFCWSLAVLAGSANVLFQDTQHLTEIGFQILFYATPVMYPAAQLRNTGLQWLLYYNPLVPFLELIRKPVLEAQFPSAATFGIAATCALVALTGASLTLARLQRRLIFHL